MTHTKSTFISWSIGVVVLIATLAAPAVARAEISDSDLAEKVIDSIQRYGPLSIFDDVSISVDNRVVTLFGRVTSPVKRDEIGKRVAKVDGVRSMTNEIKVLPVSPFDAELRLRIARAIYTNANFWQYASMALPPIHIIVEGGHVTLTGRVGNQLDKGLAYALAQVPGAFSVRNELKLDGQQ
jgi:hyperosmotically inducible protein